jgi:hypothetical protein
VPRRRLVWFLIPFAIVFGAIALVRVNREMANNELGAVLPGSARAGRVVFVMVDSLTASLAEDAGAFPALARLRPRALWGRVAGCLPASTVACTRTMLEGSSAGYVASLDNFAARRAGPESFPVLAHAQGLRVAMVSDHTFTHMLGDLGGPSLAYLQAGVPVYGWDEAARSRVESWLQTDAAEIVLVHLVDLDKASHSPGPGTARYLEQVRGADAAIAGITARLSPGDTLIVAGDHGHDQVGNHTPDPGYLAFGPAFAAGRRDIDQATIALLFSAAAATPLPPSYDGEVPERALARPFGGSREREAAIRTAVSRGRAGRRAFLRGQTLEFMPGLALAAAALGSLFPLARRRRTALVVVASTALSVGLGFGWSRVFRASFWLGPPTNLLNYLGLLLLVGGAAAYAARRAFGVSWPRAAATGLLACPLLVHLTGDDYFASVRTLSRVLPLAIALLSIDGLRAKQRGAWLAVACSLGAALLGELHGSALDGPWSSALLIASAALLYAASPANSRWQRWLLAAVPLVLSLSMRHPAWASLVVSLSAVAAGTIARDRTLPVPIRGLVLAAAVITTFWLGLGSLRFERIRFEFALAWLPTLPNEAVLALLATPLAVLKYALLVFVPLSLVRFDGNSELREATAFFTALPALSATAFVAGASCAGGSRYHETAIQEAALYAAIALLTLLVVALRSSRAPRTRPSVEPALLAGD